MHRVVWRQAALDQLATSWIDATETVRRAITAACNDVDQRLTRNASNEGESRPDDTRLMFASPLAIQFQIDSRNKAVVILNVRVFRTRGK